MCPDRTGVPLRLIAIALAAICSVAAPAAPDRPRPDDPAEIAAAFPSSVELALVAANLADQRTTPAGRAMLQAWQIFDADGGLTRAWAELAEILRLEPGRAFDELIGDRVALLVEGFQTEQPRWVVIARVSKQTEGLVRSRLRASPRQIKRGVRILSLERGAFELAVSSGQWIAERNDRAVMALAPTHSRDLLERLVPLLAGEGLKGSYREQAGFTALAQDATGTAMAVIRPDVAAGPLILWATPSGDEWTVSIRTDASLATRWGLHAGEYSRRTCATWRSLGQDTALALEGVPPMLPGIVWSMMPEPIAQARAAMDEPSGGQGQRRVLAVSIGEGPLDRAPLRATLGREVDSIDRFAPEADRAAQRLVTGLGGSGDTANFGGLFPGAVRDVQFTRQGVAGVSWACVRTDAAETGDPGWWLVDVVVRSGPGLQTSSERIGQVADALAAGSAPVDRASLCSGVARPQRLLGLAANLPTSVRSALMPLAVLARLDTIRWSAWWEPDGGVRGEFRLSFSR
ncbi:MAG: hypothetical protein H6811_01290 [Phycisphaeraceae bacterium]|nr:hypothetical protein [Phycisphaeraceae bacterium]